MYTTIQLTPKTKKMLDELKSEKNKSFDEIVRELIQESKVPKSMYGVVKLKPWTKDDRSNLDRY